MFYRIVSPGLLLMLLSLVVPTFGQVAPASSTGITGHTPWVPLFINQAQRTPIFPQERGGAPFSYNHVLGNKPSISVFPNPASQRLYIGIPYFPHDPTTSFWISLVGPQGLKVIEHLASPQSGRITLNVHELDPGLYTLRIMNPQGMLLLVQKVQIEASN